MLRFYVTRRRREATRAFRGAPGQGERSPAGFDRELGVVAASGVSFGRPSVSLAVLGAAQALSGVAALVLRGRPLRALLAVQVAALVALVAVVSAIVPALWFHPFGPYTKNVPLIVGTWIAMRRCTSSS